MELPASLSEFARRAAEVETHVGAYFWGAAGDEVTMAANTAAWRRRQLVPRVLRQTAPPDLSLRLLGLDLPHPLLAAPMAFQTGLHADGEIGLARAMGDGLYCLSTSAGTSSTRLAEAVPGVPRWYQLYLRGSVDEACERVRRVAGAGFSAVVVTVDLPVLGMRDRERDHPWPGTDVVPTLSAVLAASPLDWAGLDRIVAASPVPVLVKGILHPLDAAQAVETGAAGVVVSNHGGRQLDGVVTTADALPGVVAAVAGRVPVLVDSGIRRASDVLVALSLGASAVMLGRPLLHGLAVGGEQGARAVLELFVDELRRGTVLLGVGSLGELGPSCLF